ncbi:MAG: radical SAM/SPASM domain-containing protein [Candidatus Lernaella stagnicola]|nr:radical SAM/SPASM domain-containing protein [Candidatus Lernaella stagnicola]
MRRLWTYLRRRPTVETGPAVVTVETTTHCNLRCTFCHRTHSPTPERVLPLDIFRTLIDDPRHRIDTMHLYGMGEPLMDPHLVDRIALCRERGIQTHIATNATLLDERKTTELLDAGLTAVTFSVDTLRPEVYEDLRRGANYARTVANILHFLERRRASKRQPFVFVQMLRTEQTAKEIGAIRHFWRQRGVTAVRVCRDEFTNRPPHIHDRRHHYTSAGPCPFLWYGPALVRADGGLYPCCSAGLDGEPAANLNETSLYDFWTGPMMREIRETHLAGRRHPVSNCFACQSQKPIPILASLAGLADGITARRLGVRAEQWAETFSWRLTYRETS